MIRPGISRQLLLAGAIPAAVVTMVVGVWLVTLRVADMREHETNLGEAVASQLAPAAEYGVFSGNTAVLQRLAEAALYEADLRAVTIRDRAGVALARAERSHEAEGRRSALAEWLTARLVDADATLRFTAPVVQPLTDLGEFDLRELRRDTEVIGSVEIDIALAPGLARQLDALLTGAAILFAGLMISMLLAQRLGERIAEPIQRLADAMRRVRDGDLAVRVPESSTTELGLLESGLNSMADEIERTQRTLEERVARATADLQQTVGALEVSNVELDLARRRAIEASHLKSEFLAVMSHEIRTPMSGIIGFSDLLARAGLSGEQLEQVLTIRRSADSLMRILNDILDLSRIEAGKLTLADEPFDVRACIDDALSLMAPLAHGKGIDLDRGVSREVPRMLRGDPMRVQQIVTNLVSNAVKYTDEGAITLEASLQRDEPGSGAVLRVSVRDSGVGIATDVQHRLFKAFSQPTPTTAHYPGAGLGLVICNRLVEAMGGEIELESSPGEGSTFTVTLHLGHAAAPAAAPRWHGVTAVVADPDPLTRDHVSQLLEIEGIAATAVDPAALAGARPADVLVLGLRGPGGAADDTLAEAVAGYTHVILLAGAVGPAALQRARDALGGTCIARAAAPAALYRALAAALDDGAADPAAAPATELASLRALVVDDNRVNRTLLGRQLEALGAAVDTADGGAAALALCREHPYDVVLLDLQMPGMDGVETAQRLAADGRRPLAVAVTANAQPAVSRYPYAAGLSAVLTKPVDERTLADVIVDHHARRRRVRAALAALDPEIRTMLAEDLPPAAEAFHAAARTGDVAALRAAAHDLLGVAAVCRLTALADALATLDRVAGRSEPVTPAVLDAAGAELVATASQLPFSE